MEFIRSKDLASARKQPDQIGSLDLSYQQIQIKPADLAGMINLQELNLIQTKTVDLAGLCAQLETLPNLRALSLTVPEGKPIPDGVGNLIGLERLFISTSDSDGLPASFSQLQNLKSLRLWVELWHGEKDHLKELVRLPRLTSLELLSPVEVPDGLGNLSQLTSLNLRRCPTYPVEIRELPMLQSLDLDFNDMIAGEIVLEGLDQLNELQSLRINTHRKLQFPASLKGMQKLEALHLMGCGLETLPDALAELKGLKSLNIGENKLTSIPNWIGELTNLEELYASNNAISSVPESLVHCQALHHVHLRENKLTAYPSALLRIPALQWIVLDTNKIASIPEGPVNLPNAAYIMLSTNKLEVFPWILADAPIARLDLGGNPFVKATGYKVDSVILSVTMKKRPMAERKTLLALALGELPRALSEGTLEHFVAGLDDADAKLRAAATAVLTAFLPDPFLGDTLPNAIRVCGQSKDFPLADFKKKIEAKGIRFLQGKPGDAEIVVLAEKLKDEADPFLQAGAKPASLGHLASFVEALDKPWLRTKAAEQPQVGENFRKLLDTGTPENIKIAMQMLASGGLPDDAVSQVLALSILSPDSAIKKTASKAIETYASPALKAFLAANKRNTAAMSPEKFQTYLQSLMDADMIDARAFSKMAAIADPQLKELFLPYMTGAEITELMVEDGILWLSMHRRIMPKGVSEMEHLDHLRWTNANLKLLPEDIGKIKGLKTLELTNNKLSALPTSFSGLKELETLLMAENSFKEIPLQLGDLPQLKHLDMSDNAVKGIDEVLPKLKALKHLILRNCGISKFPMSVLEMTQLETLDLGAHTPHRIKDIPEDIGKLQHLKSLSLDHHEFKTLPDSIAKLPLESLRISDSKLMELPASIFSIKTLKRLKIQNSLFIPELPDAVGNLTALEYLDISNTGIHVLPSSFAALQNLKKLEFTDLVFENQAATLEMLVSLKSLIMVTAWRYHSNEFMKKLQKAMPNLKILH